MKNKSIFSFQGVNRFFVLPLKNEAYKQVSNDIIFRLEK